MNWRAVIHLRLDAFELNVELGGDGAPVTLVGPNGSGKTTLLRTLAGAHRPVEGHIRVGDRVLFDSACGIDVPPEERGMGYVPQGYGLFPHMRVVDNVAFGRLSPGTRLPKEARRRAAVELLDRMECGHLAHRWPLELSGGERQRVALCRALLPAPDMLLLDEPLAALDASARRRLRGYLVDHLAHQRSPSLVTTHDARDVRALGADVYVIEGGRIVQDGPAEALAARPATDFVAEFFAVEGADVTLPRSRR